LSGHFINTQDAVIRVEDISAETAAVTVTVAMVVGDRD